MNRYCARSAGRVKHSGLLLPASSRRSSWLVTCDSSPSTGWPSIRRPDQLALSRCFAIPAAVDRVEEMLLDEVPLFQKRLPVAVGAISVFPVHEQECVQALGGGPPDFLPVERRAANDSPLS